MKAFQKTILIMLPFLLVIMSCEPEIESEYQEFYNKNYSRALFILSGTAECLDAYSPDDNRVFTNLQTVGHNSGSEAWPSDLLIRGSSIYTVCSGQNVIEKYDARSLDYLGKIYLKNGFNPLLLNSVGNAGQAVISGFATDEIVMLSLENLTMTDSFASVYEEVTLADGSHRESKAATTTKNAVGDNHHRSPSGIAVSGNTVYVSNVRYDSSILLSDNSGNLISYDGANVRAAGSFREGTLSVFSTDVSNERATLVREINLDNLYAQLSGIDYTPGNGLNPQSLFVLNGKLHIVCTGTNGGEKRNYTSDEYLPEGYNPGDPVPGTDPDDGLILVMDISDTQNPVLENAISMGGSPVGFRSSIDSSRNILYLAGVGGIQSYNYLTEQTLHASTDPILAGSDPSKDYYSYILFEDDILYISNFTNNSLNMIQVLSDGTYNLLDSKNSSGGPGALAFYTK
jgi:Beta propeller domain